MIDGGKRPQRFAKRVRCTRPDFQDREMIAHQRLQILRRLIVGRVRFENELRVAAMNALKSWLCAADSR